MNFTSFFYLEDPVKEVQSCLLFLQDNIQNDQHLVDYLSASSVLCDEDKRSIREGKNLPSSGKIVKSILRHGSEECAQLLDAIRKSSLNIRFENYARAKKGEVHPSHFRTFLYIYINFSKD